MERQEMTTIWYRRLKRLAVARNWCKTALEVCDSNEMRKHIMARHNRIQTIQADLLTMIWP